MVACVIALGGNVGDSVKLIESAVAQLTAQQVRVLRRSAVRRTKAIGGPEGQADFFNAAVLADTTLTPQETLRRLLAIEHNLGRTRQERWGPRSIDLDLILYGDLMIDQADLQVPHPRMAFRRFVLEPAAEVAGELVHPRIGWTLSHLYRHARQQPTRIALWSAAESPLARQTELLVQPGLPRIEFSAVDWTLDEESSLQGLLQAPAPQLTVLLESEVPSILQAQSDLARRLVDEVCQPGRGPWLRLQVAAAEQAVNEILAAAQALAD